MQAVVDPRPLPTRLKVGNSSTATAEPPTHAWVAIFRPPCPSLVDVLGAELDLCDESAKDNGMTPLDAQARFRLTEIIRHAAELPIPPGVKFGVTVSRSGGGVLIVDKGSRRVVIDALPGCASVRIALKDRRYLELPESEGRESVKQALNALQWLCDASCPQTTT